MTDINGAAAHKRRESELLIEIQRLTVAGDHLGAEMLGRELKALQTAEFHRQTKGINFYMQEPKDIIEKSKLNEMLSVFASLLKVNTYTPDALFEVFEATESEIEDFNLFVSKIIYGFLYSDEGAQISMLIAGESKGAFSEQLFEQMIRLRKEKPELFSKSEEK